MDFSSLFHMTKVTFSDLLIYMYSTLVTMVTLTLPVNTPTLVGQLRSYTFLWYQEILSVGGVCNEMCPLMPKVGR